MRKILSFVLCVMLTMCSFVPSTVSFAEEDCEAKVYEAVEFAADGTATTVGEALFEGTLYDAVEFITYSRTGGGIVLSKNVTLKRGLTMQPVNEVASYILVSGNVKLDLNGYFITQISGAQISANSAIVVPRQSALSLVDSSTDQKGTVNGVQSALCVNGGRAVLESGTLMAQSQASQAPDDGEQVVKVTNGGAFTMSGGTIKYNGALDDGRTYENNFGSVYADEKSEVYTEDGRIEGKFEAKNKNNVHISGGFFDYDISDYLARIYNVVQENGLYTIERRYPEVKVESEDGTARAEVTAEYHETEERVVTYNVAVATSKSDGTARLDIKPLISEAIAFGSGKIPNIVISTDLMKITMDPTQIKLINDDSRGKGCFMTITQKTQLDDEIARKMENARLELGFKLTDENGAVISPNRSFSTEVYYSPEKQGETIQLYYVSGTSAREKTSKLVQNDIFFTARNGERIVVSEGSVVMITGRTLDLRGTISMVFYASLQGVDSSKAQMMFWDSPQEEYTEETAQRIVSYSGKDSNGYKFEYKNISAKDMNKTIYARLVATDRAGRKIYSDVPEEGYSVVAYARNMRSNAKLKPLLVRMVNYGTAAQEYFGSDTSPANSFLSDGERVMDFTKIYRSEAATIPEATTNGKCSTSIVGKTLTLEGDISINYYVLANEDVDEVGILFWTEDAYNATQKHIVGTQSGRLKSYSESGDYRVYTYGNIVSSQMFEPIYARVYTKTGNVYKYGDIDRYSVKDYAANQIEKNEDQKLIKLLRCLLLYGDEAEKYFRLNG